MSPTDLKSQGPVSPRQPAQTRRRSMSGRAALKMGGLPSMKRGSRVPLVPTYRASTRYLPANLALQRQVPVLRIRRAQVVGQCQVRDPERKGAWREGIRRSEEGVSKGGTRNAKGRKHLIRLRQFERFLTVSSCL